MTGEFTLNINRRPFKIKPNNIETAMIQKNFKTETMHLSQLRTLLLLGATVKTAVLFEIISKELRVLEALYEISLERPKADKEGRPILSLSTRYLKEYLKKEIYVSKTLAILQYFNLI